MDGPFFALKALQRDRTAFAGEIDTFPYSAALVPSTTELAEGWETDVGIGQIANVRAMPTPDDCEWDSIAAADENIDIDAVCDEGTAGVCEQQKDNAA